MYDSVSVEIDGHWHLRGHKAPQLRGVRGHCPQKMLTSRGSEIPFLALYNKLQKKNTFSSFQYLPYLEFKPFPLPFPSRAPPFNVDCLSLQQFFCLASNTDKGTAVWEITGKLKTPQEGELSPIFLQLVLAIDLNNFKKQYDSLFIMQLGTTRKPQSEHP